MKANLLLGSGTALNGYLNVDALTQPNQTDRVLGDLGNLSSLIDTNELSELLAIDIINFYPLQMIQQLIGHWSSLVEHGGAITISGLDLHEAARIISLGTLTDILKINQLIYGTVTNTWTIRKSFVPLQDIISMIIGNGQFDITQVKYSGDGLFFFVSAKRK